MLFMDFDFSIPYVNLTSYFDSAFLSLLMEIRPFQLEDTEQIIPLIAAFRVELAAFKQNMRTPDLEEAKAELLEYVEMKYPIFVAQEENGILCGYLVGKIEQGVVWAESLYIRPECRNRGIGSRLYDEVERISAALGCETAYNWIHPNNTRIINFLRKRGYSVLNLIEIRKLRKNETPTQKITILEHSFDY